MFPFALQFVRMSSCTRCLSPLSVGCQLGTDVRALQSVVANCFLLQRGGAHLGVSVC